LAPIPPFPPERYDTVIEIECQQKCVVSPAREKILEKIATNCCRPQRIFLLLRRSIN
jgi:hypothetical protein